MIKVVGSLLPTRETQLELLAFGFSLAQTWLSLAVEEQTKGWKICMCLCICLSSTIQHLLMYALSWTVSLSLACFTGRLCQSDLFLFIWFGADVETI